MQDPNMSALGRTLCRNSIVRVSEIVGMFVVGLSVIWCVCKIFVDNPIAYIGSIWAANMLMLAIAYGGLLLRGQSWRHLGLSFGRGSWKSGFRVVLQSCIVFVAAMTAFIVGAILMANIVGMPEGADMSKYDYLRGNFALTVLALVSVYIVSAFAEEVIYRGFLITRITELGAGGKLTRWLAILISSIVFGLVHSDWGIAGMVQASFMGLALGVSYLVVQRNLWVTILAHAYMDTILILQMYYAGA